MKASGIIVEYNPFHNGHIYHIQKARELSGCDCLIAIMSGNFVQRGEPAIINKWERTKVALKHGVDLVIELPYIFSTQAADYFAKNSVSLLEKAGVDSFTFGSETGNLLELEEIASLPLNVSKLKQRLRNGESYPKAYGLLSDSIYPNDCLGICYLRAKKEDTKAYIVKRDSSYNDIEITTKASSTAIRSAVRNNLPYEHVTPLKIDNPVYIDQYYPYLQNILNLRSREDLQKHFLINEGIEKLLKDNSDKDNYQDFIKACVNKRYTLSRLQRSILHLLNEDYDEEIKSLKEPTYLRVLGFNEVGRQYLKENKDKKFITSFKEIPPSYKAIEERAVYLYASLFSSQEKKEILKRELQAPIII